MLVLLNRTYLDQAINAATGRSPMSVELLPQFVIRDLTLERIAHQLLNKISDPSFDSTWPEMSPRKWPSMLRTHSNLNLRPLSRAHMMAPNRLKRAEDFIEANLGYDISLRQIASAAGMSLFHFAKVFNRRRDNRRISM